MPAPRGLVRVFGSNPPRWTGVHRTAQPGISHSTTSSMLTNLALATAVAFAGPSAEFASVLPAEGSSAVAVSPPASAHELPDAATAVTLRTEDKVVVKGSYYAPKKSKRGKPAPAALLLHDAASSREELEELAAYLHKRGFAVLTIDLRGHGETATEDDDFEEWSEKAREANWSLSMRDVDAAAEYLLEQDGVHASNLSVVGVGAGASLAVRRAKDDENVRAVVMVDPDPEAFGYNLVDGVAELGGLPTMVMASETEKETARRLQDAAHKANAGFEYVDVKALKAEAEEVLRDKKLRSGMANWLRDQVMPKK